MTSQELEALKQKTQTLINNLASVGDAIGDREMWAESGVVHAGKVMLHQLFGLLVTARAEIDTLKPATPADEHACEPVQPAAEAVPAAAGGGNA